MIENTFNALQKNKIFVNTSSIKDRKRKIFSIKNWVLNNRKKIKEAIWNDFKKPFEETDLTEIYPLITECNHSIKNLGKWTTKIRAKKTLALAATSGYIKYEPKGIALIISPWNYPFQLAIGPLISAIAAGNCVVIKPSEISKYTADLIEEMITELFPKNEIAVIKGGKETSTELLKLPFDHIFFTGSTEVGKIIMKAAAENLTSVTLELGGKSPIIIDETANLKMASEKIVWGKFLNSGQTCIAPDYILVDKKIRTNFVSNLISQIKIFYGKKIETIQENKSYASIINQHHHQRLKNIIDDAIEYNNKILHGNFHNNENNFISPTIILTENDKSDNNSKINTKEIFGPVLPIVEYNTLEEAIELVNSKTPPLSVYIFSKNKNNIEKISKFTQSGGVVINELMLQFTHPNLPFGGVRESGIGRSHGFAGFKEFSNERSYLKGGIINPIKLFYPPFSKSKRKLIDYLIRYF